MHAPRTPASRPPLFVRVLTSPVTPGAVERRLARTLGPVLSLLSVLAIPVVIALLAWAGWALWQARLPVLVPRHRAEALCFELEQPPRFAPPMTIEPSAAMVRGRFTRDTPTAIALQNAMHYTDEMVESQSQRRVGDYVVTITWLRLPGDDGSAHWLIVSWMEDADLAVCSFRFDDPGPMLTPDERQWGNALLARALVARNFQADTPPPVRLRAEPGAALAPFGPAPAR